MPLPSGFVANVMGQAGAFGGRKAAPPPPHPIGPPPCRHHVSHSGSGLGNLIAGAIVTAAVSSTINNASRNIGRAIQNVGNYNNGGTTYRTGGTTYHTGNQTYHTNGVPTNYPSACPHCGAGTTGKQICEYCSAYLY